MEGAPEGENPGRRIWERDKSNRLRRVNFHEMIYALTCGCHQQPANEKQQYKNHQRLKYKKRKHKLREGGDADLNKMSLEHKITTVSDLMESTLARIITLAVNDFGYGDTTNNFIVNWVHPLLLKDHYEYIKEYKPKWNQAMNCPFEDEY